MAYRVIVKIFFTLKLRKMGRINISIWGIHKLPGQPIPVSHQLHTKYFFLISNFPGVLFLIVCSESDPEGLHI